MFNVPAHYGITEFRNAYTQQKQKASRVGTPNEKKI
jgi:hypothetical protein